MIDSEITLGEAPHGIPKDPEAHRTQYVDNYDGPQKCGGGMR